MPKRRLPKLRALESLVVPDARFGRVLVLRDPQGIADGSVQIPPMLVPVVARLDGTRTLEQITEAVSRERGATFPHDAVVDVVDVLERGGFLESATFRRKLLRAQRHFDAEPLRPAEHAGGAYPSLAAELTAYIDGTCVPATPPPAPTGAVRGLCAPHIDPWRGARGYGAAYHALAAGLHADADTFIVFGTSHAPMREPFALLRKGYDTPLGAMPCDEAAVDQLANAARFDPFHDRLNHKREHSIEFQAVFLRRMLGARPATIVPILAGLGYAQGTGESPARDDAVARFLDAVAELVARRGSRAVLVAGVDLAHVGPRFGDEAYRPEQRAALERTDRESMQLLAARDREPFWQQVARDLDTRRVCGLAPMYSLLWTLGEGNPGSLVHYEQTVDAEDGSIVSHAALTFSC